MAAKLVPTPGQTVGPFFALGLDRPEWSDLTRHNPQGQRIVIEGRVVDGDGTPVPDALLELWQANAAGRYEHVADEHRTGSSIRFLGYGRAATDLEGRFHIKTIKPGPVPGRGNALQAPHISVAFFARAVEAALHPHLFRRRAGQCDRPAAIRD